MEHLDLFSGIGGFALAAKWTCIKTIAFCEIDLFCQKVLSKNFPNIPIYDDIKTFNFTDKVDLITAGFPCQPFSVAGKKKGVTDDRYLWPEVARIIGECRPTWFIGENVPGIIPMLDPILEDLEKQNYGWRTFIIPASAAHAPHKRERLWIVAHRNSERLNERGDNREERHVQDDWQQHIKTLQSKWTQFQPQSWTTFNAQEWLTNADSNSIASTQTYTSSLSQQSERNTRMGYTRQNRTNTSEFNWQEDQPPIPGVDDGLPNGLDRNKSLGNAVVPQIPYLFMHIIKNIQVCNVLKNEQ